MFGYSLGFLSLWLSGEQMWSSPKAFSSFKWQARYVEVNFTGENSLKFLLSTGKEKRGTVGLDEIYIQAIPCDGKCNYTLTIYFHL